MHMFTVQWRVSLRLVNESIHRTRTILNASVKAPLMPVA
jgi:hypothetical protein